MKLANISDKDFSKNILKVYNREDSVKQILRRGAEIRRNKIKLWKNEIPLVENIIKKKTFINYLPAEIPLDNDFQYFFGLWCGDRLGRGRFGIANKNKEINFYT